MKQHTPNDRTIPVDNYRLRTGEGQDGGMREGHFGCTRDISLVRLAYKRRLELRVRPEISTCELDRRIPRCWIVR